MNQHPIVFEALKLALTRVEAADALNISPATIDRLVKRGLLRSSKALRRPLFSIAEIERFLRDKSREIGS
jgi:DNA-binding transcriptional MerR regulator